MSFSHTQLPSNEVLIPLQGLQQVIYYSEKANPGSSAYHQTSVTELSGQLNINAFAQALISLMTRHPSLRSRIVTHEGENFISPSIAALRLPFEVLSLPAHLPPSPENATAALSKPGCRDFARHPFDLNAGPLWRAALIQYGPNYAQFVLIGHQLIFDHISKNIFMRDLSALYNAHLSMRSPELPPLPTHPLLKLSDRLDTDTRLQFWQDQLQNFSPLHIRSDYIDEDQKPGSERIRFDLAPQLSHDLNRLSTEVQLPLEQILFTALLIVIHRFTGQTDLCIGVSSPNREPTDAVINAVIAGLINNVPLRAQIEGQESFQELLRKTGLLCAQAFGNQLPLDLLVRKATNRKGPGSQTAAPFDLVFHVNPEVSGLNLQHVQASAPIELNLKRSLFSYFGINLNAQAQGGFQGFIEYNTRHFNAPTIQRLEQHMQRVLEAAVSTPSIKIRDLYLLSPGEAQLLDRVNQTELPPLHAGFIDDYLETAAHDFPERTALVMHHQDGHIDKFTYRQLNHQSNILSAYLQTIRGGTNHYFIGVALKRGASLGIATWSVFKSGGILIALETQESELLRSKLIEADPEVIIVDHSTEALFRRLSPHARLVNIDRWPDIAKLSHGVASLQRRADELVYISYTSGSTGRPKGVMIEHGSLYNAALAIEDRELPSGLRVLCLALPTFDCFFFELMEAVVTGGELHLVYEEGRLMPSVLRQVITQFNLQAITLLPQICNHLPLAELPSLRDIIVMGETPRKDVMDALLELIESRRDTLTPLTGRNEWGVQEATIASTHNPLLSRIHTAIGWPDRNTKIFILDDYGNECPPGVAGQAYVYGPCLARGYYKNHELTQEAFVEALYDADLHRFTFLAPSKELDMQMDLSEDEKVGAPTRKRKNVDKTPAFKKLKVESGASSSTSVVEARPLKAMRLYKTGDLMCRLEDGSLNYLERLHGNEQVKIHGVRIELNSLKTVLENHPLIEEALVLFDADHQALHGYLILKDPKACLDLNQINEILQQSPLPRSAKLASVSFYAVFPISQNGKVDAVKLVTLPAIATLTREASEALASQKSESEKDYGDLVPIFARLLPILAASLEIEPSSISVNSTLYRLGFDSLSLGALETNLNKNFDLAQEITIIEGFVLSTSIVSLAREIFKRLSPPQANFPSYAATFSPPQAPAPQSSATPPRPRPLGLH